MRVPTPVIYSLLYALKRIGRRLYQCDGSGSSSHSWRADGGTKDGGGAAAAAACRPAATAGPPHAPPPPPAPLPAPRRRLRDQHPLRRDRHPQAWRMMVVVRPTASASSSPWSWPRPPASLLWCLGRVRVSFCKKEARPASARQLTDPLGTLYWPGETAAILGEPGSRMLKLRLKTGQTVACAYRSDDICVEGRESTPELFGCQ